MPPEADPAAVADPSGPPEWQSLRDLARRSSESLMTYIGVGTVLIALIAFLTATQPQFATYDNFINILQTNAVLLVVSVGLTYVLLVGGFDLSVGGVLALSGVVLAKLIGIGVPAPISVLAVLLGAVAIGTAVNGVPIGKFGLSFFVVTLGSMSLFTGIALLITTGETQSLFEEKFITDLGGGKVAGVPWPVVIALMVLVASLLVTRYTGFGRMLYAVGGNAEAARLAGINVVAIRISAYAICAGLAGLAGVMEAGRLASASPTAQSGIALTAAAAVMVGGTSFVGGIGGMFGTFLGALFLGVLSNGLIISGVSTYWQGIIAGSVLIAAVAIDRARRRGVQ